MLKVLAREGKVLSEITYAGKKKKEIFSITEAGQTEFREWFESSTSEEIPRNEFLLKLFLHPFKMKWSDSFKKGVKKLNGFSRNTAKSRRG